MDFIQANPRHSWSLPKALERIQQAESGVVILLHRTEDGATLLDRTLPKGANQAYKWDSKSLRHRRTNPRRPQRQKTARPRPAVILYRPHRLGLEVVGFEEAEK